MSPDITIADCYSFPRQEGRDPTYHFDPSLARELLADITLDKFTLKELETLNRVVSGVGYPRAVDVTIIEEILRRLDIPLR